jgi:hypothetical protein
MANTQGPWGARPVRRIDGAPPTYGLIHALIAYNNGNTIARGDLVLQNSSGVIDILTPGTTAPFGVFMGCEYIDPTLQRKTFQNAWRAVSGLAATAIVDAYIITDNDTIFEIQAGQSSTVPIAQTDVGSNAQFAGQGAPNSAGLSVAYLSSVATTNTFPWRIVGLSQKIGNDNASAYNTVECILNATQLNAALGV